MTTIQPQTTQAQSIYGTWGNSYTQEYVTFNEDGSYSYTNANGTFTGIFYGQNDQMVMQDGNGYENNYTIQELTATTLRLGYGYGAQLYYERQAAPLQQAQIERNTTTKEAIWERLAYNKIVTSKNGQHLMLSDVMVMVSMLEFVIETPLNQNQIEAIKAEQIEDFKANPTETLQSSAGIKQFLKTIYQQTNMANIGMMRQQVLYAFFQEFNKEAPADLASSSFYQIFDQHLQLLTFDTANQLVLTNKSIEAYGDYMAFVSGLTGNSVEMGAHEKKILSQELTQQFPQMTLEQKQFVCYSPVIWRVMQHSWNQASEADRRQIKSQMTTQANANSNNYNSNNGTLGNGASTPVEGMSDIERWAAEKGMTVAEYLEYRKQFNANMKIMQRMQLDSHVTSLNIIENMGDSGAYWEVRDY